MSDIESTGLKRTTTNTGDGKKAATTTPSTLPAETTDTTEKNSSSVINNITIINNGSSNENPGKFGTLFSFIITAIGIIVSIIVYKYAPDEINTSAITDHCNDDEYEGSCKSNSVVLRISLALTLIFALQIVGTIIFTRFYDILWIPKVVIFIGLVILFFNISDDIFGTNGYGWFARITGFFFLILEQIILIDLAYTWNEKWIEYSQEENVDSEVIMKGNVWLIGIVFFSFLFYALAYACIGIMFWQFDNTCVDSMVILSLTIVLPLIASVIQLFFSDQGSILTSAIMTLYSVYVCYSAISLNPDSSCNPTLNSGYQTLSSIIGLVLTGISLCYSTYSAVQTIPKVTDKNTGESIDLTNIATGGKESSKPKTDGEPNASTTTSATITSNGNPYESNILKQLLVQVSLVFLCVSGYYAMVLTNWGTEQTSTSISNPRAGRAAMWIQATGSWIAIALYLWSLVAPKVLKDRDF